MAAWTLVLQFQSAGGVVSPSRRCRQLTIPGLPWPCRILFYACDSAAVREGALVAALFRHLSN